MKLIYIANARMPTEKAHGIQIMKTCEALAASGVNLELWVPKRRNAALAGVDAFDYYKVARNFSISYLPSLDLIGLLDFLPGAGYFIQSRTFAAAVARRLAGQNSTDAVYYSRELSALAPAAQRGLTCFYEAHTFQKRLKESDFGVLRQVSGVVVISGYLAEIFKKYLSEEKLLVAPDGVDLRAFDGGHDPEAARKELGFPRDARIVGYAGHLYEWKGAHILAQASEYLEDGTLVFFLGGTETDLKHFRELCSAKHYRRVRILGAVAPDKVPLYLAAADVLVLPNSGKTDISRFHTSPLKLFEYMAARRPIVASDLPSLREILDESTAIFFVPDDPLSLSKKIKFLLADPGLSERLATNARRRVETYSWENRAKAIKNFIASGL